MAHVSAVASRFRDIRRSAAQTRVLDAAYELIAQHGVSGTSLQMIGDALGFSKAAVYRQFKTKDESSSHSPSASWRGSKTRSKPPKPNRPSRGHGNFCCPG